MHSHVTMDSQITHNSMCVSSIPMQCNLHRHCSHSSDHRSWTSILRSGFTIHFSVRDQRYVMLKAKIWCSPNNQEPFCKQSSNQSVKWWSKHCRIGTAALSPKSRLISPIMVQASCTTQQKPNCCFSKQRGYCSCVTILPMLIQRMQY